MDHSNRNVDILSFRPSKTKESVKFGASFRPEPAGDAVSASLTLYPGKDVIEELPHFYRLHNAPITSFPLLSMRAPKPAHSAQLYSQLSSDVIRHALTLIPIPPGQEQQFLLGKTNVCLDMALAAIATLDAATLAPVLAALGPGQLRTAFEGVASLAERLKAGRVDGPRQQSGQPGCPIHPQGCVHAHWPGLAHEPDSADRKQKLVLELMVLLSSVYVMRTAVQEMVVGGQAGQLPVEHQPHQNQNPSRPEQDPSYVPLTFSQIQRRQEGLAPQAEPAQPAAGQRVRPKRSGSFLRSLSRLLSCTSEAQPRDSRHR